MSDKPKLLIIGPTPPPYHGVAMAIRTLLDSKLGESFEVRHLELADRRGIQHVNKVDAYDAALFLKQWFLLVWLLITIRPQMVYLVLSQKTGGFLRDSLFVWPVRLFGCRMIAHVHGGEFRAWFDTRRGMLQRYARLVLGQLSRLIVLGESLKSMFSGLVPDRRVVVVENGIEGHRHDFVQRARHGKQRWRILHLTTLNEMKGTLIFLQAIPWVIKEREDVEFICAGPWSHLKHRREAELIIAAQGLAPHLTFHGQVVDGDKWALLESADVFVFPGIQQEGQPLVVIEAMAAGLPVIYTDRGCLRETVIDGLTGLEVPANSPEALANRILWLLDRPEDMIRLGRHGRMRFEARYTKKRFIEKMIDVFADLAVER
jgi:glycosyltransferase involved in cell wall biosynthesis